MTSICCICKSEFPTGKTYKKKTCSPTCSKKLQKLTMGKASANEKHGFARRGKVEKLHGIWRGILKRCYCRTHYSHTNYGARGIGVCAEWKNDYSNFREWYLSKSESVTANLTVERINNDGDYSPENCRLASAKDQARNRRSSRLLEYNGECKTVAEWAELFGVPYARLHARINRLGWSVSDAISYAKDTRLNRGR